MKDEEWPLRGKMKSLYPKGFNPTDSSFIILHSSLPQFIILHS